MLFAFTEERVNVRNVCVENVLELAVPDVERTHSTPQRTPPRMGKQKQICLLNVRNLAALSEVEFHIEQKVHVDACCLV